MGTGIRPEREDESGPHAGPLKQLCGPWASPHTHMVGEKQGHQRREARRAVGHHAAGSKGSPRKSRPGKDARWGGAQELLQAQPSGQCSQGSGQPRQNRPILIQMRVPPQPRKAVSRSPWGMPPRGAPPLPQPLPSRWAASKTGRWAGSWFCSGLKAQPPLQSRKADNVGHVQAG